MALALSVVAWVGCQKKKPNSPPPEVDRTAVEAALVEAKSRANAVAGSWRSMRSSVAAAQILGKPTEPCPAKPQLDRGSRPLINLALGGANDPKPLLAKRMVVGDYSFTPPAEVESAKSPTQSKLEHWIGGLRSSLDAQTTPPERVLKQLAALHDVDSRYDVLVVVDDMVAPEVTSPGAKTFDSGYAIGRAYLMDHETDRVVCFASFAAENSKTVPSGGALPTDVFLEVDLVGQIQKAVAKGWWAAVPREGNRDDRQR